MDKETVAYVVTDVLFDHMFQKKENVISRKVDETDIM